MKKIVIMLMLLMSQLSFAVTQDIYQFDSVTKSHRFHHLLTQFRCLVCQNEDLADSNAKLAADLRRQIYTMINSDKNNTQIKHYLVARYGDFVLYNPPVQANTLFLWLAPIILLVLGFIIVFYQVYRRRRLGFKD